MTTRFAYFLGVLLGDGSLGGLLRPTVYLVGHLIDERDYYDRVIIPLMAGLFNVSPYSYVRKGQQAYATHFKSKRVVEFLASTLGFPTHGSAKFIPVALLRGSGGVIKALICGLFDSDGCLVFSKKHREIYSYPTIEIKNVSKSMILEIVGILRELGFRASMRKSAESWVAAVNGDVQVDQWMKRIGSRNIKHLSKYLLWKRQGSVQPHTHTPQRLELLHLDYDGFFRALKVETEVAQWL